MRTFTLLLLLIPTLVFSQKDGYKFKKVSKELLEQTQHPLYPDAPAAFEQNRCEISFFYDPAKAFICKQKVSHRIKIYKEEGKKYGNYEISLYKRNYSDKEKISDIDAFTFNLVNGKPEKVKLSKEDIYQVEVNENYDTYSFALPNVQVGSVIELSYTFETPFYFSLDPYYMQRDIPVNNMYYNADFPQYFSYNPIVKGAIKIDQKKSVGEGSLYINSTRETVEFRSDDWIFTGKDIPPIKQEPYVHNMDNYASAISWELRSTNFPGSHIKNYNTSWDDVAINLHEHSLFGKFLNAKNKDLKQVLSLIDTKSNEEKTKALYEYVSLNYKWNGRVSSLGGNMSKLIKEKRGNSGQINLLLINLLRQAGIEVYPVVLKTRSAGYMNIAYPTLGQLNYVIAAVKKGEGFMYLDATAPLLPMGFLPERALNLHGVILTSQSGRKINIKSPNSEAETHLVKASLTEDMKLTGNMTSQYVKYSAYNERREISRYEKQTEYFSSKVNEENVKCSNEMIENFENINKPLKVSMDIDYSDLIQEIDGKIFIPTLLNMGITENPYREEERLYNLNYSTLENTRLIINYPIPENYEIESKPDDLTIALPDKAMTYRFSVTSMNNTINITSFLDRKSDNISYDMYPGIREIYGEILKRSSEQIVLKKKN